MNRRSSHDLSAIQAAMRARLYVILRGARDGAAELHLDEADVCACVLGLDGGDFYKTMESDKRPGLWQDVYRPRYAGYALYVKVQLDARSGAVVISFKRDQSR